VTADARSASAAWSTLPRQASSRPGSHWSPAESPKPSRSKRNTRHPPSARRSAKVRNVRCEFQYSYPTGGTTKTPTEAGASTGVVSHDMSGRSGGPIHCPDVSTAWSTVVTSLPSVIALSTGTGHVPRRL
jgi:hypothetical protein